MLVAAGGLCSGFAASRFLKASSSRRYWSGSESYGDRSYDRTYATGSYDTGTSTTSTFETGSAGAPPPRCRPPATTPATGTPGVGTYDGPGAGQPLGDPLDDRRS